MDKYTIEDPPCIKILLKAVSDETKPPNFSLPVTLTGVKLSTPLMLERETESSNTVSLKEGSLTSSLRDSAKALAGEQD